MAKPGRNDPCPCGSGKKYKKCCLSKVVVNIAVEGAIKERLVQELLKLFGKNYSDLYGEAFDLFWDCTDPEEYLDSVTLDWSEMNFHEWIVFDFIVDYEPEKTLIDAFVERKKNLSESELAVLKKMRDSYISMYEVQEVFIDQGLRLKDLILGGEYYVEEKMATRSLRKWDIYGTRLLELDGKHVMSGALYPYSLRRKEWMLDWIKSEFKDYRLEFPKRSLRDFLKTNSELFNFFWYDQIANPGEMRLTNKSGDEIVISKAFYRITDKKAVHAGLKKIKGFEKESGNIFVWLSAPEPDGSATLFGKVIVKEKLTLETNSKERLEVGKFLIKKAVGKHIVHEADTFEDPMQKLDSLAQHPLGKPSDDIPAEVERELYEQFMRTHCEKWLTESIPALSGKTPMQAVRTKTGKNKVAELLKQFENAEEHKKQNGEPHINLSFMWERLGLTRE